MLWIETSTCSSVDLGDHCSSGLQITGLADQTTWRHDQPSVRTNPGAPVPRRTEAPRQRREGEGGRDAPAGPRPEEGETDLAAVVQVRVEAHRAAAGRAEVHKRRLVRVLERDEAVELEQPPGVRRPVGPGDHDLAAKESEVVVVIRVGIDKGEGSQSPTATDREKARG